MLVSHMVLPRGASMTRWVWIRVRGLEFGIGCQGRRRIRVSTLGSGGVGRNSALVVDGGWMGMGWRRRARVGVIPRKNISSS
jgi:hypothetical protein